jgi:membrane protein implicated in regulation of membrane protease activity
METASKPPNTTSTDRRYILLAFRIMGEFGASIAIPVVALAVLGKKLDTMYGTAPYLRVTGFVIAAVITAALINKRARDFGKEYEALGKEEEANKQPKP